jgi:hypothetical protein
MSRELGDRAQSLQSARIAVAQRLRARRPELTAAIVAQIGGSVSDRRREEADSDYATGVRLAVGALLDYALVGIELGEQWSGPVPPAVVTQARRAARGNVGLDDVLLRCNVVRELFNDFVLSEAAELPGQALRHLLGAWGAAYERLIVRISTAYKHEAAAMAQSAESARVELVQRLLSGASTDAAALDYRLEAWHLGLIATGAGVSPALRGLAARLGRRLLIVPHGERTSWAWLGGSTELSAGDLQRSLSFDPADGVVLAVGEAAHGASGWRMTHAQAQATLRVVRRDPQQLTRFADVALLALVLREDTMTESLESVYLKPFDAEADGGATSRSTLRAYFAADHNVRAAAARLGVDRNTVRNRLDRIERRLGYRLHSHRAELDVALRLDQLRRAASANAPDRRGSG